MKKIIFLFITIYSSTAFTQVENQSDWECLGPDGAQILNEYGLGRATCIRFNPQNNNNL
jgi:hypothetical protein